jgi:branched-chain amino acid transport system permease protein
VETLLQTIANSLMASGSYALMAVGLVLIFGVMGIINLAHGELYMVGAYTVWYTYTVMGWPFLFAVVAAVVLVSALGLLMERFLFRPMLDNPLGGLINSIGMLFILQVLAVKFGGLGSMKHVPISVPGNLDLFGGASISMQRAMVILVTLLMLGVIWFLLTRTKYGWALRAVAEDREAAALQGISINRTSMLAMGLGSAAAGLAGAMMAPIVRVHPYMGHEVIITALIVTIVGGMGSLSGAVIAAVLYAFFSTFVTTYLGGTIAQIMGLALMLIVLVIKPTGIMGRSA